MKTFVHYLLIVLFFFWFLKIFSFLGNYFFTFESSVAVLVGSAFVFILSLILANLSVHKVVDVIRSK